MRNPRGRGREPEIRIPRRIQIDAGTPAPTFAATPSVVSATTQSSLLPTSTNELVARQSARSTEEKRDRQLAEAIDVIKKMELGQTLMANANSKMEAEITRLRDSFKNMAGECGRALLKMKEEGRVQGHKEVIDEIGALWRSEHFCLELLYGKMTIDLLY